MRYYYLDSDRRKHGPYTAGELRVLHARGLVKPDTEMVPEDGFEIVLFRDLWGQLYAAARPPEVPPVILETEGEPKITTEEAPEGFTAKAGADLKALVPHLLMPFEKLRDLHWLENRKMLAIAAIGLLPLIIISIFGGRGDLRSAYWAIAFYFSALWGMFFYYVFPAPGVRLATSVGCFFGTGFFSISLLLLIYQIPPLNLVSQLAMTPNLFVSMVTFIFGVGLPEETCKALALFIVAVRLGPVPPQTMLFYGLMSGLGFGIYEGVGYQMGRNIAFSSGSGEYYYLLNLMRLTSLPFLHSIWTGIAGYFIGFATQFPDRRYGLWIVAIGLPALFHGLYNAFSGSLLGFAFAILSVLTLYLYLAKSMDFERALRREP
jgi:protease PrsW